jgi:uncharacterized repeat protein (TIGR01451 family)
MINKKIIFLILFFAIVIIFISFWLYRESMFSKEILRLEILGPEKAEVGKEIEYTIKYKNNGNFVLENPKLIFDLPQNSLTEDNKTRLMQDLEDIYPGKEELIKIKTRLLGKEQDLKTAKAIISYVPKNLTARYESETSFTIQISSVPITLDFDLPSKVEKGKQIQYSINYFSNIDYPLENLALKIYPVNGLAFESSDPKSLDDQEWRLETLNKAQGGRINITGRVAVEEIEKLNFKAEIGMWQNGNFVVIKETEKEIEMILPLLFISQQVNGNSSYIASPGETLHYKIFFRNIGSTPFEDLFMIVRLDGSALDFSTIEARNKGQVQPNDNMIIWDYKDVSMLKNLNVQEEGFVEFYVKVKDNFSASGPDQASAVITTNVNLSQMTQNFTVKVNSGLTISQKAFYKSFDMQNSGPIPPRVGQATTFTIQWDIRNYFSDAKNVRVKATLPQNVSLTGKIMPEWSNFLYDSASREVTWSPGDILAGTGVNGDPYMLSFQVSLVPSQSQKGSTAPLISQVQISGENQFTGTLITAQNSGVNTSLPDDFENSGGGIVQ